MGSSSSKGSDNNKPVSLLKANENYTYRDAVLYDQAIQFEDSNQFGKAIECYNEAIRLNPNMVNAFHNLALLYEDGLGTPKNINKAIELYESASKLNSIPSMYNVAALYYSIKNFDKAFFWTIKAYYIVQGMGKNSPLYVEIVTRLAFYYQHGVGINYDFKEAIRLYEEAIVVGYRSEWIADLIPLCILFSYPPDVDKATKYFKMSNTKEVQDWGKIIEEAKERTQTINMIKKTSLGDYEVVRRLGAKDDVQFYGMSSAVYLIKWKSKNYALKVLCDKSEMGKNLFIDKPGSYQPNIVSPLHMFKGKVNASLLPECPLDDGEDTEYYVYPYYKCNLDQYLKDPNMQNINIYKFIRIMLSLLQGIIHLRIVGIIHRDLKLDNILLDDSDNASIADFGLSIECKSKDFKLKLSDALTPEGQRGGARAYLPPEITKPENTSTEMLNYDKSDVFALGCVGYQMLNKSWAFGENYDSRTYQDSQVKPFKNKCPEIVEKTIREMIRVNVNERMEASQALKSLLPLISQMKIIETSNQKNLLESNDFFNNNGLVIDISDKSKIMAYESTDTKDITPKAESLESYALKIHAITDVWKSKAEIKKIGKEIDSFYGMDGMLTVHDMIRPSNRDKARSIESIWDGVGSWLG